MVADLTINAKIALSKIYRVGFMLRTKDEKVGNKLIGFFDRYYFWLKSVFKDDDKYFGSRQLYLFSLTIWSYFFIPIFSFTRLLFEQKTVSEIKPFMMLLTVIVLALVLKICFNRYKNFKEVPHKYTIWQSVINTVIFFFPFALLVFFFYEK